MKKSVCSILCLIMALVILSSALIIPSFASNSYTLTDKEISQIQTAFRTHGWTLKKGFWANDSSTGRAAIKGAQKLLLACGYSVTIDGSFGPATDTAVRKFQKDNGLTQDGVIGKGTFSALVTVAKSSNLDLNITAPGTQYLQEGETKEIKVSFSGKKISSCSVLFSGGLSGGFTGSNWKAYPDKCDATIKVSAPKNFAGGTVTFNLLVDKEVVKSAVIKVEPTGSGYNREKALEYAKNNWNRNSGQLCAEFVSNCLKSGGFTKAWSTGCTTLDRQLSRAPGVTKTKLIIEGDGSIRLSKNKNANIKPGDVISIWCPYETDGCPYVHTVLVGNITNDRVSVYAHNSARNNEIYYSFDYCGYCHICSSNIAAYLYHFE